MRMAPHMAVILAATVHSNAANTEQKYLNCTLIRYGVGGAKN